MKWIFNIVGALLAFGGLIWFLEGIGALQNSLITADSPWGLIGLACVVAGAGLLLYTNAEPRRH